MIFGVIYKFSSFTCSVKWEKSFVYRWKQSRARFSTSMLNMRIVFSPGIMLVIIFKHEHLHCMWAFKMRYAMIFSNRISLMLLLLLLEVLVCLLELMMGWCTYKWGSWEHHYCEGKCNIISLENLLYSRKTKRCWALAQQDRGHPIDHSLFHSYRRMIHSDASVIQHTADRKTERQSGRYSKLKHHYILYVNFHY